MRDSTSHQWPLRRFALVTPPVGAVVNRLCTPATLPSVPPERELPGPDGIRHELVARVRREIAAGTYDTEEMWFVAEAEMLRQLEQV